MPVRLKRGLAWNWICMVMDDDFQHNVVVTALEGRDAAGDHGKQLNAAIKECVTLPGFRNPQKAPTHRLAPAVASR